MSEIKIIVIIILNMCIQIPSLFASYKTLLFDSTWGNYYCIVNFVSRLLINNLTTWPGTRAHDLRLKDLDTRPA